MVSGNYLDLRFAEHTDIGALDLSGFLFDVDRIYALAYKVERDPYEIDVDNYRGYGRNSFRVPKEYQLAVSRIGFQSPGFLSYSKRRYRQRLLFLPSRRSWR
jgi:hypothetical protein